MHKKNYRKGKKLLSLRTMGIIVKLSVWEAWINGHFEENWPINKNKFFSTTP